MRLEDIDLGPLYSGPMWRTSFVRGRSRCASLRHTAAKAAGEAPAAVEDVSPARPDRAGLPEREMPHREPACRRARHGRRLPRFRSICD